MDLKDGLIYEQAPLSTVQSALSSSQEPMPLVQLDEPGEFSDSRDGHHNWSLYGNSGSHQIQSTGEFGWRFTTFFGTESRHPDAVGTSRYDFGECLSTYTEELGGYYLPDGKYQKLTGKILGMANTITLWSGLLNDRDHTPASAQYYITLTIRRRYTAGSKKFHLLYFPVTRMANVSANNAGHYKLRVYNDSNNTLLGEREELRAGFMPGGLITNISNLVSVGDTVRVEYIAQLALTNPNSPKAFVKGGSSCGMGFVFDAV